jgi:hypothetical protein
MLDISTHPVSHLLLCNYKRCSCKILSRVVKVLRGRCLQRCSLWLAPTFIHSFIHSFIHPSMVLHPFVGPWPLLQFRNHFYTDGRIPCTSKQPVTRRLPKLRTTHTQTSLPRVGFEPTIPAFEQRDLMP